MVPRTRSTRKWFVLAGLVLVAACAYPAWASFQEYRAWQFVTESLDRHEYGDALTALEEFERRGVNSARTHYQLAVLYRRAKHHEKMKEHLAAAEAQGWPLEDLERQAILWAVQSGDIKLAEDYLVKLPHQAVTDELAEEYYEAYVRGCLTTHKLQLAFSCLEAWIEFQPQNPTPRLYMGDALEHIERVEEAQVQYEAALEIDPGYTAARVRLAHIYLMQNKVQEALAGYQRADAERPNNQRILMEIASCHSRLGNKEEAYRYIESVLGMDPDTSTRAFALREKGRLLLTDRKPDEAIAALEQAVALYPADKSSHYALGQALRRMGRRDEAKRHIDRAEVLRKLLNEATEHIRDSLHKPDDPQVRYEVGSRFLEMGLDKEGVGWLLTALVADPRHMPTHEALADHYSSVGDEAKADYHFEVLDKLDAAAGAARAARVEASDPDPTLPRREDLRPADTSS